MSGNTMMTYQQAYIYLQRELHSLFEAKQVWSFVTGQTLEELLRQPNHTLTFTQQEELQRFLQARQENIPLQYLLGEWEFYGLPFFVGEGVLIPRADTERLVDVALDFLGLIEAPHVLELCAGSGAVAVAIATHSTAHVTAVEYSPKAFCYLTKNIIHNKAHVTPVLADLYIYEPDTIFDCVVSNPPYIAASDIAFLQPEVQYEPRMALDGGEDGLDFYRFIIPHYWHCLRDGGKMVLEIGALQESSVTLLFEEAGYRNIEILPDLAGINRVVAGYK